jgi:hypothetical protein
MFDPLSLRTLPTRRAWLAFGLSALASKSAWAKTASPSGFGRAKSVLFVFTSGGQSQLETWDPKPNSPEEIRGAFGSIASAVPGVRLSEHLPELAKCAKQYAIIRSMTHDDTDHGSACYLSLTGQFHAKKSSNPPPQPTDAPTLGAVLQRVQPAKDLPHASCMINGPLLVPIIVAPGLGAGLLGRGLDPLMIGDPTENKQLLEAIAPSPECPEERLANRRLLLNRLETQPSQRLAAQHTKMMASAYDLIQSHHLRKAFDLGSEKPEVRDRYGRHRSGQACLLARRLIEAGVPWVTTFFNHNIRGQDEHPERADDFGWDTHNDIFSTMKDQLLPRFDRTFSVLLDDLKQRGLLKQTLVICVGEFGRAPRVALEANFAGTSPGRKHWAACYSAVLAGAGVTGGAVFGSSDRNAAYPQSNPVSPGDLAATAFHALGIDPGGHYTDPAERPYRIASGEPILKLFS